MGEVRSSLASCKVINFPPVNWFAFKSWVHIYPCEWGRANPFGGFDGVVNLPLRYTGQLLPRIPACTPGWSGRRRHSLARSCACFITDGPQFLNDRKKDHTIPHPASHALLWIVALTIYPLLRGPCPIIDGDNYLSRV